MGWLDKFLGSPIEEAHDAANDLLKRAEPIIHTAEMTAAGILDTLITRIGKAKVTITIEIPKAGEDWEKTPP